MSRNDLVSAIILAGGKGERAGLPTPKQFFRIDDREIIFHTLEQYLKAKFISDIILVVHPDYVRSMEKKIKGNYPRSADLLHVIPGGDTRQRSIYMGLKTSEMLNADFVIIHDGVRQFFPAKELKELYRISKMNPDGGAITCTKCSDIPFSTKDGFITETFDRETISLGQTPQCFRLSTLLPLHEKIRRESKNSFFDVELMLRAGKRVACFYSNEFNQKITFLSDIAVSKKILSNHERKQGRKK